MRRDRQVRRARRQRYCTGDTATTMTKASRTRTRRGSLRLARRRRSLFAPVEEAIAAIRDGRLVIVVDDEDRENEGDLTIAAEKITPDVINFMVTHGRGLVCL